MKLEENFDNITFKHVDGLRNSVEQSLKMIQSLVSVCFLDHAFFVASFANGHEK